MNQSDIGICNLALAKLSAEPIASIAAPVKPNEKLMALLYPQRRDAELRKHRWLFSLQRLRLTPSGTTTAGDPFLTIFQMPNAALRAVRERDTCWTVQGRSLLDPSTTYIDVQFVMQTSPSLFDPLFVDAVTCALAFQACEKVTQSNEKKKDLAEEYREAMDIAKKANAFEVGPEAWVADDSTSYTWEQARASL